MLYTLKDLYRRICNVFRWLPTIWNDKDFNHRYITEILIKKLEFTRDFYLSDKAHIRDPDTTAKEIQEAIDRLHMTRDDWEFYEEPFYDELEKKWGKSTIIFEPTNDGYGSSYLNIEHENVKTSDNEEQYSKEFDEGYRQTRREYMNDKKEAYLFIAENIDGWWD